MGKWLRVAFHGGRDALQTTGSGGETRGRSGCWSVATQDSLIKRINSLMSRFNSLLGRNKFPVPMRRELHGKPLNCLLELRADSCTQRPTRRKFPVFSQLAGNLASETSSLETCSSSKESAANLLRAADDATATRSNLRFDGNGSHGWIADLHQSRGERLGRAEGLNRSRGNL
jgi:hypothetical protein